MLLYCNCKIVYIQFFFLTMSNNGQIILLNQFCQKLNTECPTKRSLYSTIEDIWNTLQTGLFTLMLYRYVKRVTQSFICYGQTKENGGITK